MNFVILVQCDNCKVSWQLPSAEVIIVNDPAEASLVWPCRNCGPRFTVLPIEVVAELLGIGVHQVDWTGPGTLVDSAEVKNLEKGRWTCRYCNLEAGSWNALKRHMAAKHHPHFPQKTR